METEEQIVYQLLEEVRGSRINNDEVIGEREIRAYMRERRASLISSAFASKFTLTDDEFQDFGLVTLVYDSSGLHYNIPPIIKVNKYSGIRVFLPNGYVVPITSYSDFQRSLKNPLNGNLPKGYAEGDKLYISKGSSNSNLMGEGYRLNENIELIETGLTVKLELVLYNPDDLSTYDWTSDRYPLSPELISKLKNDIKRTSLSSILQTKNDEVGNSTNDYIRYHDKGNVQ